MPATPPPTTSAAPVDLGGEPDIRTPLRYAAGPTNSGVTTDSTAHLGARKYSGPLVHASTRAQTRVRGFVKGLRRVRPAADPRWPARAGVIQSAAEAKTICVDATRERGGAAMDADLILTNGRVYTVDAARSRHEALAVKDGRIVGAGERGGGRRVGRSAHADRGPRRPPRPARLRRRAPAPVVRHRRALRGQASPTATRSRSAWTGWRASPPSIPSCRPSAAAAGIPRWSPRRG